MAELVIAVWKKAFRKKSKDGYDSTIKAILDTVPI